jgi:hypothetical protein
MRKLLTMLAAALLIPGAPVLAQSGTFDASCQPVKAAMVAMVKTNRYHATGTITNKGKTYPTEEIYVGDTLYEGMASQWSRTAVTPQDRIGASRGIGLTTSGCRKLGNECNPHRGSDS